MSYTKTRDQRIADEVMDGMGPCMWCQASTLKTTLGQYGARCHPCYERYCQEGSEPVEGLTFEKFAVKLRQSREQILRQHNCRAVRFHVYVKDGKAALKATPVAR